MSPAAFWIVSALLLGHRQLTFSEADSGVSQTQEEGEPCAVGCNEDFIGDRNCDVECFYAACEWDGGDCDAKVKLERIITMGRFHDYVDHVTYELTGPDGKPFRRVSMEEGRIWDGTAEAIRELEHDWRASLAMDEEASAALLPDDADRTYEWSPWKDAGVDVPI